MPSSSAEAWAARRCWARWCARACARPICWHGWRRSSPSTRARLDTLLAADPPDVGTPVHTSSFTGLFDPVGPKDLAARPVLLTAAGGSAKRARVSWHQLRPLFGSFQPSRLPGCASALMPRTATLQTVCCDRRRLNGGWTGPSMGWPPMSAVQGCRQPRELAGQGGRRPCQVSRGDDHTGPLRRLWGGPAETDAHLRRASGTTMPHTARQKIHDSGARAFA